MFARTTQSPEPSVAAENDLDTAGAAFAPQSFWVTSLRFAVRAIAYRNAVLAIG